MGRKKSAREPQAAQTRAGSRARRLRSEEDIKNRVVIPWLEELGIGPGDVQYETEFNLVLGRDDDIKVGEARVRTKRAYSDILVVQDSRPLFVIEVKRGGEPLDESTCRQALSYARLLHPEMAPFAVVTDGAEKIILDVANGQRLYRLQDSTWLRNNRTLVADPDLRALAAQALLSFSADMALAVCRRQHTFFLEQLVGSPELDGVFNVVFSELLYEPRTEATAALNQFWPSTKRCFAAVGTSGVGKTSFLCALALGERERRPLFFFDARRMSSRTLGEVLQDEYAWLVGRDVTAEQVAKRLADVAAALGTEFLIVLDGIDDHPSRDNVAKDLDQLIKRTEGKAIRFAISSKLSEWHRFAFYDSAVSAAAKETFGELPPEAVAEMRLPPAPSDERWRVPGTFLSLLSGDEIDAAWPRYQRAFGIGGMLRGELREQSRLPFSMRMVADAFQRRWTLPETWEDAGLLELWLRHRELRAPRQHGAHRRAAGYLAEHMIQEDRSLLDEDTAVRVLAGRGIPDAEQLLAELVACGMLVRTLIGSREAPDRQNLRPIATVACWHDRFVLYLYAFVAAGWDRMDSPGLAAALAEAAKGGRLSRAAVNFYLRQVANDRDRLLAAVLAAALPDFVQEVANLPEILSASADYEGLVQLFRAVRDWFAPHVQTAVGGIDIIQAPLPRDYIVWGLRPLQPLLDDVAFLDPDDLPLLPVGRNPAIEILAARGAYRTHARPNNPLIRGREARFILDVILKEISELARWKSSQLDESGNPDLARARIQMLLPRVGRGLGIDDPDEFLRNETLVAAQGCDKWLEVLGQAIRNAARGARFPSDNPDRFGRDLVNLYDAVNTLSRTRDSFGPPAISLPVGREVEHGYRYMSSDDWLAYLRDFFPAVLRNYRELVSTNWPMLRPHLPSLRRGSIYLHGVMHTVPSDVPEGINRHHVRAGGRIYVVGYSGVWVAVGSSPTGRDEVRIELAEPGWDAFHADMNNIPSPWGPQQVDRSIGLGFLLCLGEQGLLQQVYRLLEDDMQALFGEEMWPRAPLTFD